MSSARTKLSVLVVLAVMFISGISGCVKETADVKPAVLEGKVNIGPRVETGFEQPYAPEIYQPRKIMVYDAEHINLVNRVDISDKGYYRAELPGGITRRNLYNRYQLLRKRYL